MMLRSFFIDSELASVSKGHKETARDKFMCTGLEEKCCFGVAEQVFVYSGVARRIEK